MNKEIGKNVIVSASNSRYFSLLKNLIESAGDKYPFGILDIGLEESEIEYLKNRNCIVTKPTPVIAAEDSRLSLLGYTERPRLPELFPGFDSYLWLDSDTWVQDRTALDDLFKASYVYDVCCVPEIDRNWIAEMSSKSKNWKDQHIGQYFGEIVKSELFSLPMINSGVVCARGTSKIWSMWISSLSYILLENKPDFGVDQIALMYAIYKSDVKVGIFPVTYNWLCHICLPLLNNNTLVEPCPPYSPIKIIHLTDNCKTLKFKLDRVDGGSDVRFLGYDDYKKV